MTFEENSRTSKLLRSMKSARTVPWVALGFIVGMTLISLGMSGAVEGIFGTSAATTLGQTGQVFESVGAVFSGLAFIALVVTFLLQLEELRLQREELRHQRHEMSRTQAELHRSAEADLRSLHVELLKMAISDEELGKVWPDPDAETVSHSVRRQFWYANLIYQHLRLALELGSYNDESTRAMIRNLFKSPVMRSYWKAGIAVRAATLVPESREWVFAKMADEIYLEMLDPPDQNLRLVD
jgi:hypothetical protein